MPLENQYGGPLDEAPTEPMQEGQRKGGGIEVRDEQGIDRARFLPLGRNRATGEAEFPVVPGAVMGLYEGMKDAVTLPKRAFDGEPIHPSDTMNFAMMTGPAGMTLRKTTAGTLKKIAGGQLNAFRKHGARIRGNKALEWAAKQRAQLKHLTKENRAAVDDVLNSVEGRLKGRTIKSDGPFMSNPRGTKSVAREGYLSPEEFHQIRINLNDVARAAAKGENPNYATASAANAIKNNLDEWFGSSKPDELFFNPRQGQKAQAIFSDNIKNYAAAKRAGKVQGKLSDAELRADATNSGKNFDNVMRNKVAKELEADAMSKRWGYSPEELAMARKFVEGGKMRNTARNMSNRLGGGGGLGQTFAGAGAGAALWGADMLSPGASALVGGGVMGAGAALKGAQNALSKAGANRLSDKMMSRAPYIQKHGNPNWAARQAAADTMMRGTYATEFPTQKAPPFTSMPPTPDDFRGM